MLDIMLICEVAPQMRCHLGMRKELLILTLDILTQVRVVRGIMADGLGCVFRLEGLKAKEILHGEFELGLAILAASAVFIHAHRFLERGHGIEYRIDDNLAPWEVGTKDVEAT